MAIIERIASAIGLATQAEISSAASRAYEAGFLDANNGNDDPVSGDLASQGYSRLTSNALRDFTQHTNEQILSVVWILYQSNPLAKRYLQIKRDHILGRGISPESNNEDLQVVLDDFWDNNELDKIIKKFTLEQYLFGEQCYPVFVRPADGRVKIGYIDPQHIDDVIVNPHNALDARMVILKPDQAGVKKIYRIIGKDEGFVRNDEMVVEPRYPDKYVTHDQIEIPGWEQLFLNANGLNEYTGSCFYFSVNNVSNQPRGFSDLLQVADWLDADDETLFALADREQMAGYFSWKVKLTGADESQVKAKAAEIRSRIPKRGQALVANENEEWSMEAPDLKQQATIATSEALTDRAWGLLGMPKHWRGIGDGSNFATAAAMGDPVWRTLEHDQDATRDRVMAILHFVRDQADIAGGVYTPTDEDEILVNMPQMTSKDMAKISTSLAQVIVALVTARDEGFITPETATRIFASVASEIGENINADDELREIEEQDSQIQIEDQAGRDDALARALNGTEASGAIDSRTALNGAQVQAAMNIVIEQAGGRLPREIASNMLQLFFNMLPEQAAMILSDDVSIPTEVTNGNAAGIVR